MSYFPFKNVCTAALLFSGLSLSGLVNAVNTNHPNAFRVDIPSAEQGRRLLISFHHAVLDSHLDQGYVVLDLNEKDQSQLKSLGFELSPDSEWQVQYQRYIQQLTSIKKSNQSLAGIPGFACYPTVEETYATANQLATDYSNLAEWLDIGDSWLKVNQNAGHDLMVLKMTNRQIGGEKPKFFIHSAMHAREYATAALTLKFAQQLLNQYANDPDVKAIIDHQEIHILFQMNPDGRKIAETGVYQRKNVNQNHCPNDQVGVDLNRNFAFTWNSTANGSSGQACDEDYRGQAAESEPETQAVSQYVRSLYPDLRGTADTDPAPELTAGLHLDIHSYGGLVLWPFGHTNSLSANDQAFVEMGHKLAWYNNYSPQQSIGLYPTDGTSDDVSYGELGVAALTFELGTRFFQDCATYQNKIEPDNLKALMYAAKLSRAPYHLAYGPEVDHILLNGSAAPVVTQNANLEIELQANALQTKKSATGRRPSKVEYSIDQPIWETGVIRHSMSLQDGSADAGVEVFVDSVAVTELAQGEHRLYFQGFDQADRPGVISVARFEIGTNASPVPEFSNQCQELSCNFDASQSQDPDGSIVQYNWQFGDNSNATGQQVSHSYQQSGTYLVRLELTDNLGATSSREMSLTVTKNTVPPPNPPSTNQSGGGGSLSWWLGLGVLLLVRKKPLV